MLRISTSSSHGGEAVGIEPGWPAYKPCLLTTTPPWLNAVPGMETDRAASTEAILKIHDEFSDVLPGIGCFNEVLLRCVAYILQQPLRKD